LPSEIGSGIGINQYSLAKSGTDRAKEVLEGWDLLYTALLLMIPLLFWHCRGKHF